MQSEKRRVGGDCDWAGTPTRVASMPSCHSEPVSCAKWICTRLQKNQKHTQEWWLWQCQEYDNVRDGFVMLTRVWAEALHLRSSLADFTCGFITVSHVKTGDIHAFELHGRVEEENSTKQLPLSIFISCSNKLNWNSFQQSLWPTWRGQCDTYIVLDNLCCEAQCLNHPSSFFIQSSKYSDFSLNGWDFSLEEVRCLQNSFQPSGNLGCTRNWISGVVTWGWT